jgi:hypothetical protein
MTLPEQTPPRDPERDRTIVALRLNAPKRSREAQDDPAHLPLFVAGNEPMLV